MANLVREPFGPATHSTPEGAVRGMLNALAEGGGDPTHAALPDWLEGDGYNELLNELPPRFGLTPKQFAVTKVEDGSPNSSVYADYLFRVCDLAGGRCTLWRPPDMGGTSEHRFTVIRHGAQWKVAVEPADTNEGGLDGAFGELERALGKQL